MKRPQTRLGGLYHWRGPFLRFMREDPAIGYCAERAGVSRRTVLRHQKKDPAFAAAIEEAIEHAVDRIEAETFRDARSGDRLLKMFILKSRRRSIYGEQPPQLIDVAGLARMLAEMPQAALGRAPLVNRIMAAVPKAEGNGHGNGHMQ
ncbi:MAG: hypothetical protein JXQ29_18700 [Planctomycetes bacterium]|nr:hypothetical protein [Planctomycetota bacterium]